MNNLSPTATAAAIRLCNAEIESAFVANRPLYFYKVADGVSGHDILVNIPPLNLKHGFGEKLTFPLSVTLPGGQKRIIFALSAEEVTASILHPGYFMRKFAEKSSSDL